MVRVLTWPTTLFKVRCPEQHCAQTRDEFMPWHKVRKQFIRARQWNKLIVRMVERYLKLDLQHEHGDWSVEEGETDAVERASEVPESIRFDRPLRCLVIPGDDLLDLRSLWNDLRLRIGASSGISALTKPKGQDTRNAGARGEQRSHFSQRRPD